MNACIFRVRMHIYANALASTPIRAYATIDAFSSLRNSAYIDRKIVKTSEIPIVRFY